MRQHLLPHLDDLRPGALLKRAHRDLQTILAAPLVMKTDVVEHDDDYTVTAELPGFDKDAITVKYADDWLTLSANSGHNDAQRDDDGRILRRERQLRTVTRRFYLKNVVKKQIQAHYHDGLLTVTLPKKVADDAGHIEIQ